MTTRRLPALNSFDYEYLLYQHRRHRQERADTELRQRRRLIATTLRHLAEAMSFLQNDTVLRGMQLELY